MHFFIWFNLTKTSLMGKGDKKTKRGKIISGTYGVRRLRKRKGLVTSTPERKEVVKKEAEKPKETAKKKSPKSKEVEEQTPPKIESAKAEALPAEEKKVEAVEKKVAEKPKKGKKTEASSEEEPSKGEK